MLKKFVIEREIDGVGELSEENFSDITSKSCSILKDMGPEIEWLESYVTGNKIYCIYQASDEQAILEHAEKGGFPANQILEVKKVLKPIA
jgi:hypothetical protein